MQIDKNSETLMFLTLTGIVLFLIASMTLLSHKMDKIERLIENNHPPVIETIHQDDCKGEE